MQTSRYWTAVRLFNAGRYFEAHEAWEEVWNSAEEPQRRFLQGLIQAAVAMHHYQNRNLQGAISLGRKALGNLHDYPAGFARINLGAFRIHFAAWLEAIKTGASASAVPIHVLADEESGDAGL